MAPTSSSTHRTSPPRSSERARSDPSDAELRDVGGPTVHTEQLIAAIERAAPGARITFEPVELPFPSETGDPGAEATPLQAGVADAIARFEQLLARGLVTAP